MAAQLDKIVFHVKAGTMRDKTERLVALVRYLGDATRAPGVAREMRARSGANWPRPTRCRSWCGSSPTSRESWARSTRSWRVIHPEVAQALREQFLPDAAGGVVPETLPGALLATAEKVDNIVAAFACGEPPSGSKDPYGLRRAAAGNGGHRRHPRSALRRREAGRASVRRAGEVPRSWSPRGTVVAEATDLHPRAAGQGADR